MLAARAFAAAGSAAGAHLALLAMGAMRRVTSGTRPVSLRFAVLVPAHDEEVGIADTVTSLRRMRHGERPPRIVVIADNCTDSTARRAAEAGAEVLVRYDPARRGKGYALAWGFERVLRDDELDAVAVVDADCRVSENLLGALARALAEGGAAQCAYLVANPDDGAAAAVRAAGFAVTNTMRPRGRSSLGLSAGLLGTGMAFRRELLERHPWRAFSYAEDREQHLALVLAGERVAFAADGWVSSPMPVSLAEAEQQQARWESGRLTLARRASSRLVRRWWVERDLVALDAALEPLMPSQAVLAALNGTSIALGVLSGHRRLIPWAAGNLAVQVACVGVALRLVNAPPSVYRSLVLAPALVARRVALLGRLVRGRGPSTWVRTTRRR